ncbi:hypothetical protein [Tengunoibacter tsumagoiensis]|uniref:Uncharacterized protein n=1 Tax=Tengunoibacter tsumagoiensis TaxID=2014871 RepID=A0A402A624_9CHLR|nr:hypothetical protein [Tengunoibacter tsumagoiensis]GCE14594.1 hypothetical protein KTT_44530 [Tengunoibacter tsumagoiensis]
MAQSEVARLRRQIEAECEDFKRMMTAYAAVASHDSINRRYQRLTASMSQLEALIDPREAQRIVCETYIQIVG